MVNIARVNLERRAIEAEVTERVEHLTTESLVDICILAFTLNEMLLVHVGAEEQFIQIKIYFLSSL